MPEKIRDVWFLTIDDVIDLHAEQIALFGGLNGIRDRGLVESAVNQPRHVFGDRFVYDSVHRMAAALLFSLARNHGFIDGNKRTASRSTALFYRLNDYLFRPRADEWAQVVVDIAIGVMPRQDIADYLQAYALWDPDFES